MNGLRRLSLFIAMVVASAGVAMGAGPPIAGHLERSRPDVQATNVAPADSQAQGRETIKVATPSPSTWYYKQLSGASFLPANASTTIQYWGSGCIYLKTGDEVMAQFQLPDNATIQGMNFTYYRGSSAYYSRAYLYEFDDFGDNAVDFLWVDAAQTGWAINAAVHPITVENNSHMYQVFWVADTGPYNLLCSVRVSYTLPAQGIYTPLQPCRAIDTRSVGGSRSTDGPNLSGMVQRSFQISGLCGVPTGSTAVTANVTTDQTTASSVMAIWPSGTTWPGNSTLNWSAGQTLANFAVLTLGSDGKINAMVGAGSAALILDITGYYY
jgi:hypothetical protein